jgi:DNA-binding transcriptional LysR family regulator
MNYTLNQCQVFLKICETRSITNAAKELHLTQPAVSIQLRNFQNQFDIPLTEIVGKQIYITEFGNEVANSCKIILEYAATIQHKAIAYKGQLVGKLKISVVSTGKYIMPYFLTGFMEHHKSVQLLMDVTNKKQVIESLRDNEVDFALVSILPEKLAVEKLDLIQNKLFLVGNAKDKLHKQVQDKHILEEIPLIYRESGSGTRQTMERFIERNNIPVNKKIELTSNEAVKQAVLAGLGYSIMPLIGIKNELQNRELKIVPVKGLPIKTVWTLIWLKGKKHSPVADAFLQTLKKEKKDIMEDHFKWYENY